MSERHGWLEGDFNNFLIFRGSDNFLILQGLDNYIICGEHKAAVTELASRIRWVWEARFLANCILLIVSN